MSLAKNIQIEFDANPKHFNYVPFLFEKFAFYAANFNRKAKKHNGYSVSDIKNKLEAEIKAIIINYKKNADLLGYKIIYGFGGSHFWVSLEHGIGTTPTRLLAIMWEDKD